MPFRPFRGVTSAGYYKLPRRALATVANGPYPQNTPLPDVITNSAPQFKYNDGSLPSQSDLEAQQLPQQNRSRLPAYDPKYQPDVAQFKPERKARSVGYGTKNDPSQKDQTPDARVQVDIVGISMASFSNVIPFTSSLANIPSQLFIPANPNRRRLLISNGGYTLVTNGEVEQIPIIVVTFGSPWGGVKSAGGIYLSPKILMVDGSGTGNITNFIQGDTFEQHGTDCSTDDIYIGALFASFPTVSGFAGNILVSAYEGTPTFAGATGQ